MSSVSLVMITRNAVMQLEACILSARALTDDIVVLDSDSDDGTQALAVSLGARVLSAPFSGFGPQKRKAVAQARHDWVLCLDADERLTPELVDSIAKALAAPKFKAYRFARRNQFFGRYLKHGEAYPDWSLRLFDRRQANWSEDSVHEKVICTSAIGTLNGDLLHDSAMNLSHYLDKQNRYTTTQAEQMFSDKRRASITKLWLSPLTRFVRFYFFRRGFLDGAPGFAHIVIGSFFAFVKYAKLRELWRLETDK